MSRRLMATFAGVLCVLLSNAALTQAYPNKPIRVLTASPGGALDVVIRTIGNAISGPLGQPIVVVNRPSNQQPLDRFAKDEPDGYSLAYYANSIWIAPFIREKLPYDPVKDFAPISLAVVAPNVLVVNAALPVNSVKELVALAKAKPGELNVFFTGSGSSTSLATLLFENMAGVNFTGVRYSTIGLGMNDLAAGRIHVMFPTLSTAGAMMKAGKIKGLAVTSRERSPLAPDLPPLAEAGYPNYESVNVQALIAPARTPTSIVNHLNREVVRALAQSDIRAKLSGQGLEAVGSTPADLARFIKAEMARMGKAFRDAGIKPGDWSE